MMDASQPSPFGNDVILGIASEVITTGHSTNNDRPSSRALLAFAVRLAGSWKSTVTLVKHHPEQDDLRAISNDCAVILRCMYDAFLQMRWVADGPNDPDKMGQLYLNFLPVENYQLMKIVLSQKDALSKRVINSPLKREGLPRSKENYNSVKDNYPNPNGKGVRKQWYPGSLAGLARDLGATEEYTWYVRRNNSSVHTGPRAMFGGSQACAHNIETLSRSILVRGLGVLVKHDKLRVSELAEQVITAYSTSLLATTFGS